MIQWSVTFLSLSIHLHLDDFFITREHGWRIIMRLARCPSPLSSEVKPGQTELWLDG